MKKWLRQLPPRTIGATIITTVGILLGVVLLACQLIGSVIFTAFSGMFLIIGMAIYLAERLREFSLKDLTFKLDKIKEVKKEVLEEKKAVEEEKKYVESLYSEIQEIQKA